MSEKFTKKSAFSLLELSVMMMVIGILLSGSLALATFAINIDQSKTTSKNMNASYRALKDFLIKNKRLPCPASLNLSSLDDDNYGKEAISNSNCLFSDVSNDIGVYKFDNKLYGMLPSKALGIEDEVVEDGYGNKLSYIVDGRYTLAQQTIDFNQVYFATSNNGEIIVKAKDFTGNISASPIAQAIITIISHGPNKKCAYQSFSRIQFPEVSQSEDEAYNCKGTFGVNKTVLSSSDSNDNFDDIVLYKTRDDLVNEFNLQYMIACDGSTINDGAQPGHSQDYPQQSVFFNQKVHSIPDSNQCKTCGIMGAWSSPGGC